MVNGRRVVHTGAMGSLIVWLVAAALILAAAWFAAQLIERRAGTGAGVAEPQAGVRAEVAEGRDES